MYHFSGIEAKMTHTYGESTARFLSRFLKCRNSGWVWQIKHEGTREHFGLRVDKSLLSTPVRANNSYVYRENVPLTLDEAIFEVAGEAISQKNVS